MGGDYSVRVIAGGAVEEYCFARENCGGCPGKRWYGRHVVLDIDDPGGPDQCSRAVPYCHRDIVRTSTCKGVDNRVCSPICPISESPCERVLRRSPAARDIPSNRVSSCWARRTKCESCSIRLDYSSKDCACHIQL